MKAKRTQAREAALKILYQLDVTKDAPEEGIRLFLHHHRLPAGQQPFLKTLVTGARERLAEIDKLLSEHTTNWTVDRMSMVDRNVLRLAVFELVYGNETPPKVVINEAVELAKRFGTPDSGKFVNGVLDSIHKSRQTDATDAAATTPTDGS
ncbi:MAG: transcription antitermination factor NusB [Candidatus Omnitrophica bacterium]|nr:transcription antitermination factor NusB [Candidatus Omnitrophota bacterium]